MSRVALPAPPSLAGSCYVFRSDSCSCGGLSIGKQQQRGVTGVSFMQGPGSFYTIKINRWCLQDSDGIHIDRRNWKRWHYRKTRPKKCTRTQRTPKLRQRSDQWTSVCASKGLLRKALNRSVGTNHARGQTTWDAVNGMQCANMTQDLKFASTWIEQRHLGGLNLVDPNLRPQLIKRSTLE